MLLLGVVASLSEVRALELPWISRGVRVARLRCEYRVNPLGIDCAAPRLSWVMESSQRGQRQTAYEILVASSEKKLRPGEADLWDSGRVESDESIQVPYAGAPLVSRQRCYWKVRVWDKDGKPEDSAPAFWEMGLLQPDDWQAQWIGFVPDAAERAAWRSARWIWFPEGRPPDDLPAGQRFFRRQFVLPAGRRVARAQVRFAADDQFVLFVNGREAVRSSGKVYSWKILFEADVRAWLVPGPNLLAVVATNAAGGAGVLGQLHVEFDTGAPLTLFTDNSWKASREGQRGWETAVLGDQSWPAATEVARWGEGPWRSVSYSPMGPAAYLRRTFDLPKAVREARLYASALGVYEFHLNGQRVGADFFTPGWTDYTKRVQYQTHDVTALLRKGRNALGIVLGDGWYAGYVGLGGRNRYGSEPLALGQLEVTYTDGTRDTFVTDGSWRAADGPIRQSDLLMGEVYDARREMPGWDEPAFADSPWQPVGTAQPRAHLVASLEPPVRRTQELPPRSVTEPKPGVFVFDLGQNMVGWVRLRVKGEAGRDVTLRFAEMLNPDGTLYTANLRSAQCQDRYVLKGGGTETFEPHFTFHGFRYVQLSGYSGQPAADAITGVVVHSDTPEAGRFSCSDPRINQLQSNIVWSQRGNFLSVPTDCPQRDERLGWTGDAQIFARTATFNADVAGFLDKWMVDVGDAQQPDGAFTDVAPSVAVTNGTAAWGDAGVIVPWTMYQVYGDRRILERHYAAGARWLEYLERHSTAGLRPAAGYGDWLSIEAATPKDVLATACFASSARRLADIATILGRDADARGYAALFGQVKEAFNRAYVAPDGRIKGDTQTGYVLALDFDLLPPERRGAAAQHLVQNIASRGGHLSTGFVGVRGLLPVLTRAGYPDLAYQLLTCETFPSWLYSIRHGATTLWERWDGWTAEKGFQDPSMNSFNHYAFGSVGEWLCETVGGIGLEPDRPAFKHIRIQPRPGGGLRFARTEYDSIHGRIACDWELDAKEFRLRIVIPANTTARVYVLSSSADLVREGRRPATEAEGVVFVRQDGDFGVFDVQSGTYEFRAPASSRPR